MQQKRSYVGPRGWAVLTLVSGAALASPFLRAPDLDVDDSLIQPPTSHTSGLARLASMEFPSTEPNGPVRGTSDRSRYDLSDLTQQILPPASASPTELPAWAPTRSPIDQLISQGVAPPWQSDSASESTIEPLSPWINEAGAGQRRSAASSPPAAAAARAWPDATSLPSTASIPTADRRQVRSDSAVPAALGSTALADSGSQGSLVGNLTGTSQTTRAATTPRLRAPEPAATPPTRRHFVYQPGFNANSP